MNANCLLRRPVGCLKMALRQTRQQRLVVRSMATTTEANTTEANTTPEELQTNLRQQPVQPGGKPPFAVWPQLPSVRHTHKNPMLALDAQQRAKLDPTGSRTSLFDRSRPDAAKVGDVLMVTTKTGAPFSGVCTSYRRRGVDTAICVRGQILKVSVERWFKIYSPTVLGIDIAWRKPKRARRARLTYMRKPKHDMGNVDALVKNFIKERYGGRRGKGGMRFEKS
ncbi:54S ribosomal protein subunit img1, mitochondrial [Colletotrichum sojae]|uniref:54S ribosomal protein subunit img1, mitochondrial n=1 Tax=Colletotrichum sojae TaxID=2175907 RepID=A0A8H6JWP3_9PEZI|nr:54S ribosomal protein subunit img1, mitochondrial [Colletotrichum sojae]